MLRDLGRPTSKLIAVSALVGTVSFGGVASAERHVERGPSADTVAAVEDAIEAIEEPNGPLYDNVVDRVTDGGVWLPQLVFDELLDRNADALDFWLDVLDDSDIELYSWASVMVEYERKALDDVAAGEGGPDAVLRADEDTYAVLEMIEHRDLPVPPRAHVVLRRLPIGEPSPGPVVYAEAAGVLDRIFDSDDPHLDVTPQVAPTPSGGWGDDVIGEATDDSMETPNPPPVDPTLEPTAPQPEPDSPTPPAGGDVAAQEPDPNEPPTPNPTGEATPNAEPAIAGEATATPAEPDLKPVPVPAASDGGGDSSTNLLLVITLCVALVSMLVGVGAVLRGRRHDKLADIAFTDGLTGLRNRRRMDADVAEQQEASARPTATLMIDVDHFKRFNDTYGHATGDEVLRLVGLTLASQFRKTDVPYRYGGEEFCVLLPETTEAEAMFAGERFRAAVEQITLPVDTRITVSIGVSIGPASAISDTLERADSALYAAKEGGRNRVALG